MDNSFTISPNKTQKTGGGNLKDHPVIGIVKDNIDPTRSGIIQVEIEGSTNPEDSNKSSGNWLKVRFLSTYFGSVVPTAGDTTEGTYKANPSSYGQWQSPPDIGTEVVCIFIEGDPNRGFYIGAVPKPESLHMVPAIGSSENIVPNEGESKSLAGATRLPVTNLNTNNKDLADSPEFNDSPRPVHSYSAAIMAQQGIIRDPVRGPISSSASREPTSRVGWGVSTPGRPIYSGGYDDSNLPQNLDQSKPEQLQVISRRGGHSIVMDDGDIAGRDQLVRIRTALGHQLLMSDDGQFIGLLLANGQGFIEMGREGTVDVYSTNSINLRTHGDINFHADQHINFHAGEDMNFQAKNLHMNSDELFKMRSAKDFRIDSQEKFTVLGKSAIALKSEGEASLFGKGETFINGSKVKLNSGNPSTTPEKVSIITPTAHTDTLFDDEKGFVAAPGKLISITSRAPAHYPWANAGKGVDVKTTLNAPDNLPVSSSGAASNTTAAGAAANPATPNPATTASVPDVPAATTTLDKNTTAAVMSTAASNATASANLGAVIRNGLLTIGAFSQSPAQMVQAGILKPGTDRLINSLINSGKPIEQIITSNMFTGRDGITSIGQLARNLPVQTRAMSATLATAQNLLVNSNALTGKESAGQSAGLIYAAATSGIGPVVSTLNSTIQNSSQILSKVGAATSAVRAITSSGGLSGLVNSVTGMMGGVSSEQTIQMMAEQAKGPAASAFSSIVSSLKPLQANKSQNVGQASKQNATNNAVLASTVPVPEGQAVTRPNQTSSGNATDITSMINSYTGVKPTTTNNTISASTNPITGLNGAMTALSSGGLAGLAIAAATTQAGGIASTASVLSAGVNNLPGQLNAIGAVNGGSIANTAKSLVSNATGSLTSSLMSKLPLSEASSLLSSIGSFGGSSGPKSPSFGDNTFKRVDITNLIRKTLNDPGIPMPKLLDPENK